MGAGNVSLAFANWASLDDRSFRVLCRMALVSMDNGNPPRYFAGRDDLAAALGKALPAKPDDTDDSPAAEAARKARASVYEVVRKAVARLVNEGVIVSSGDARFRNRAEYSLYLHRPGQPQQDVAPVSNDSLPQQPQQSVAPMTQQNVAPLAQQIVGTDPTDHCPLGVQEPLKEELIGIPAGADPCMAHESPEQVETEQGEIDLDLPAKKPPLSKAALAKQMAEDFTEWYEAYPKHIGRGAATNAYTKARKNGATAEELIAGARRYAAERKGEDPRFTAQPATWLNQERWTDDPTHMGEIDVDAILGKDYWTPGTPPEGLSVSEEIGWKKEQRALRNAERLAEAKAKAAAKPLSPWDPAYHQGGKLNQKMHNTIAGGQRLQALADARNVPRMYAWCNTPEIEAPEEEQSA